MDFPPEIWEHIFRNCSGSELLQFRLVCHRWKDIVLGSPSLRGRLSVRFRADNTRSGFTPANLPPVTTASFCKFEKLEVGGWWPQFGRNMESLIFHSCQMSVGEMFYLLRHCPRLKRIEMGYVGFRDGPADNNFKLESLEELSVLLIYSCSENPVVFDQFGPIFPRLKSFSLCLACNWKTSDILSLSKFIQAVQGTLQILQLPPDIDLFDSLVKSDRLHLKQADFSVDCNSPHWDLKLWTKFCQGQWKMQDFGLRGNNTTNEALCIAVQHMPQLKQLIAVLGGSSLTRPTFLHKLSSSVKSAQLRATKVPLDFRTQVSPSLREFRLISGDIRHGIEHLTTWTHLEQLILQSCNLSRCPVPSGAQRFSVLKYLALNNCEMSPEMLEFLLGRHPLLEGVTIFDSRDLTVDAIVNLLWRSPKLEQVTLYFCPGVAETTGEEIMESYFEKYNLDGGSRNVEIAIKDGFD